MPLVRLCYFSETNSKFKGQEINDILSVSRKNNSELRITGLLNFNRKFVFQCLEGERQAVHDLYLRIVKDKRHSRCCLIDFRNIEERLFSAWDMGYVPETKATRELFASCTLGEQFDPTGLEYATLLSLLSKLRTLIEDSDA